MRASKAVQILSEVFTKVEYIYVKVLFIHCFY
jgi:hypothetical protein